MLDNINKKINIKLKLSTIYHSQINDQIEQNN